MKITNTLLILALIWIQPVLAGVTYEFETKENAPTATRIDSSQVMAQGRNLKMRTSSEGGQAADSMIYRGDSKEMIVIDHNQKQYYIIDQETARKLSQRVNQAMQDYEAMLKEMPPEQRAMAEQMMKSRMPAQSGSKPQIKKTGQRKKINGYPCVLYEARKEGRKTTEFWVTDWQNVQGGRDAAQSFIEMSEMVQHMTTGSPYGNQLQSNTPLTFIKQYKGFPVMTREFNADETLKRETQLRAVKQSKLVAADFSPPAGYHKKQLMQ